MTGDPARRGATSESGPSLRKPTLPCRDPTRGYWRDLTNLSLRTPRTLISDLKACILVCFGMSDGFLFSFLTASTCFCFFSLSLEHGKSPKPRCEDGLAMRWLVIRITASGRVAVVLQILRMANAAVHSHLKPRHALREILGWVFESGTGRDERTTLKLFRVSLMLLSLKTLQIRETRHAEQTLHTKELSSKYLESFGCVWTARTQVRKMFCYPGKYNARG